jgi:hypothetical protein
VGGSLRHHAPVLAAIAAYVDARLAVHWGEFSDASRLVARCRARFADRWYEGFARSGGAELALVAGLPDAEAAVRDLDPYAAESDWAAAVQARCRARLDPGAPYFDQARMLWLRIGAEAELVSSSGTRATDVVR